MMLNLSRRYLALLLTFGAIDKCTSFLPGEGVGADGRKGDESAPRWLSWLRQESLGV